MDEFEDWDELVGHPSVAHRRRYTAFCFVIIGYIDMAVSGLKGDF